MPCINVNIAAGGPLLIVHIGVSIPRFQALTTAGMSVPPASSGTFLVDTGASCSCVDPTLIAGFGLQPIGRTQIATPSTMGQPHFCDQFDISIFIPSSVATVGHLIPAIPVLSTHLRAQGIDGLIGRDVLKACTLIYNGTADLFTIAY